MTGTLRAAAFVAGALALGASVEAGKGPSKPETPFAIRVFTAQTDTPTQDSTGDVRRAVEKKPDWFRLVENEADADIVLELVSRDFSQDKALVVRGRLTTANLSGAPIVGQCIPGVFDIGGPWKSAAGDMVKRVQNFARESYDELAQAQKQRAKRASASAGR
jgi:hypothetical protein